MLALLIVNESHISDNDGNHDTENNNKDDYDPYTNMCDNTDNDDKKNVVYDITNYNACNDNGNITDSHFDDNDYYYGPDESANGKLQSSFLLSSSLPISLLLIFFLLLFQLLSTE